MLATIGIVDGTFRRVGFRRARPISSLVYGERPFYMYFHLDRAEWNENVTSPTVCYLQSSIMYTYGYTVKSG